MLSIKYIRENLDEVKEMLTKRHVKVDLEYILSLDAKRVSLIQKIEELRAERNTVSKSSESSQQDRKRGKEVKELLKHVEPDLKSVEKEFHTALAEVPNIVSPKTPVGRDESENVEHRQVGKMPELSFEPKNHLQLAEELDLIDFKTGAKVAGSQFYYLKNDAVLLEQSLIRFALDQLIPEGFIPVTTPDMAKSRFYLGTGFQPKGDEAQIYTIEGEDLGLIATSEITLAAIHADEVLNQKDLPIKYVGISHCFRKEAGAYGQYSKGLYRVHQFTKVEMFVYCTPDQSDDMHDHLLDMEEKIHQKLEIPYRVLEMCTCDLGAQAARKFDLEAWLPGRNDWGEITSTSNTTDYQATRLNIKYRSKDGSNAYAHTLNGTVVTSSRTLIALLENFQNKDGSITIPKALRPYFGKEKITR